MKRIKNNNSCLVLFILFVFSNVVFGQNNYLDEPTTILPECGSTIKATTIQSILFQWQLSNGVSAGEFEAIKYEFKLYEITDSTINPMNAINNNKVLLINDVKDIAGTHFQYDMASPTLEAGKRYVYTIKAVDTHGKITFKNNGVSEVCWFTYK